MQNKNQTQPLDQTNSLPAHQKRIVVEQQNLMDCVCRNPKNITNNNYSGAP